MANVAGCVALLAPGDVVCSRGVEAAAECETAACGHCVVGADLTNYEQCAAVVSANGCSAYANAASCDAERDGGAAATCFAWTDFRSALRSVALVFCGP